MKLKQFKERKQKKMGMIVGISSIVLLLALVFVYRTYSIYQESQEFDVIRGSVPDQNYDVMFTFYFIEEDGTKSRIEKIPEGKNYQVDVECNQEATGVWDEEKWGAIITNLTDTRTKCGIIFEEMRPLKQYGIKETVVEQGSGLYKVPHEDASITYTSDATAIANLKKTEYRYAGSNPNNYVRFNEELWRVIGLVNTPEGQRLKLIRDESIGNYSWDTSASNINNGFGVNEWSQSDIKILLNERAYYNRNSGNCYIDQNNKTTSCNFSSTGLTQESKQMIDIITWNTGSNGKNDYKLGNVHMYYNYERSNNTGKICNGGIICNDTVTRTTSWKGQVGLMYPSDYGYATSGGDITSRTNCLNKEMSKWHYADANDCKENDWIFKKSNTIWTMTSVGMAGDAKSVFDIIGSEGHILYGNIFYSLSIFPSIYLKPNISIISGMGMKENPYILSSM